MLSYTVTFPGWTATVTRLMPLESAPLLSAAAMFRGSRCPRENTGEAPDGSEVAAGMSL